MLTNVGQVSESLRRAGASGRVQISAEVKRSTSPALHADVKNIGDIEIPAPSMINLSQDWSENVTDTVSNNTTDTGLVASGVFPIDEISLLHEEFLARKARLDEDTKWIKLYHDKLDALSGGAEVFTIRGHEVATYRRNGNLNLKRLESEQPELVHRYTRLVQELKFDKQAFEAEEPETFNAYRAKVFRLAAGARTINAI